MEYIQIGLATEIVVLIVGIVLAIKRWPRRPEEVHDYMFGLGVLVASIVLIPFLWVFFLVLVSPFAVDWVRQRWEQRLRQRLQLSVPQPETQPETQPESQPTTSRRIRL